MTMVWLLWESQSLREVFAGPDDAEVAAAALRAALRSDDRNAYTGHVRIDRWTVSPADPPPPRSGCRVLDWIEEMSVKWPLLTLAEMGTGHFFEIEHYLAVVHGGVLKFPLFQFQLDRTQWPGFREALTVFRNGDWDEASIALWFTGPQAVTNGQPPAFVVQYEPDTVIAAARKLTAGTRARPHRPPR